MLLLPFRLARRWLRSRPSREAISLPVAVREIEERIPTIDEHGNRRTVIRTRTMATFQGPTGVVEIEQARRHTLPGFGHVYPTADNEYVVFRDHTKLRADPQMSISSAESVLHRSLKDVDYPEVLPGSMTDVQARDGVRSKRFAVTAGLICVSIALAIATLPPPHEPSSSITTIAVEQATDVETLNRGERSDLATVPTTSLNESPPMAPSLGTSLVSDKHIEAHQSPVRVAFAIRPWGEVYVNGKKQGPSPPIRELKLKPGKYTVEIRNGTLPRYRGTIDVRTKAAARVTHDFTRADMVAPKESGPSVASVSRLHTPLLSEQWPR